MEQASQYASNAMHLLLFARCGSATAAGKIIGMCNFYLKPDDYFTCELWGVAVDESFRQKGIAKALLCRAMEEAVIRGAGEFWIRFANPEAPFVAPMKMAIERYLVSNLSGAVLSYEAQWGRFRPGVER